MDVEVRRKACSSRAGNTMSIEASVRKKQQFKRTLYNSPPNNGHSSPSERNKELFPQPLGPQTSTLIPLSTCWHVTNSPSLEDIDREHYFESQGSDKNISIRCHQRHIHKLDQMVHFMNHARIRFQSQGLCCVCFLVGRSHHGALVLPFVELRKDNCKLGNSSSESSQSEQRT